MTNEAEELIAELEMDLENASDDEIIAGVVQSARTRGALLAYKAAIRSLDDPKAASQARVQAQRTVLLLSGMLDKDVRKAATEKQPHEMTGAELTIAADRAAKHLAEFEQEHANNAAIESAFR